MIFRHTTFLFALAAARTVLRTAGESEPTKLAAFVTNLSKDSLDVPRVSEYLTELLQRHLEVQQAVVAAPVQDPQINSGSVFTYTLLNDGIILVDNSDATPDAYGGYASKWKGALEYNPDVTQPIVLEDDTGRREYTVDSGRFEFAAKTDEAEIPVTGKYEEGLLADTSIDSASHEVEETLASRYQLMQLKLHRNDTDLVAADPEKLVELVDNVRNAAAAVLSVPATRIALSSIKDGVVQFSVYPATDAEVQRYAKLWNAAVSSEASALTDLFGESIDYSYPPSVLTGATTTTVAPPALDDKSSGNAGVVAGAVAGSLAGAGGAGALAVAYRRRRRQGEGVKQGRVDGEFDSVSPSGLTNVDIRGELTPGNYRG